MLTNENFTFARLAHRFDEVKAYEYLEHMERAANTRPQRWIANPELRMANLLRAQDAMRASILSAAA